MVAAWIGCCGTTGIPRNGLSGAALGHPETLLADDHALGLHLGDRETSPVNAIGAGSVCFKGGGRVEIEMARRALVTVTSEG